MQIEFCRLHFEKLTDAIVRRGMVAWLPDSDESSKAHFVSRQNDGLTLDNFDPMVGAQWAIMNVVRQRLWWRLARIPDHELVCPLCLAEFTHAQTCEIPDCPVLAFDNWIELAADAQLETLRTLSI